MQYLTHKQPTPVGNRKKDDKDVHNAGFWKPPYVNLKPLTMISELPKTGPVSGSTAVQA